MSITAADLVRTAAVSPRVQTVDHTGSTNADLLGMVTADPSAWPHLSVLVTDDQRSGRGRLDRTWTAPRGSALAISAVVRADAIPAAGRGWIPLAAGAAMTRAVRAQLGGAAVTAVLKWPNDVLVEGRKLCGILAEVVPDDPAAVVVGAGVNTGMTAGQLPVDSAVSLRMLGVEADADRLVADYLSALDELLRALAGAAGDAVRAGVHAAVESLCATVGSEVAVVLPDGARLQGVARRIDPDGRLVVADAAGDETAVGAGDVVHVR